MDLFKWFLIDVYDSKGLAGELLSSCFRLLTHIPNDKLPFDFLSSSASVPPGSLRLYV